MTAHALQALSATACAELYEYSAEHWRARRVDPRDMGYVDSWLVPRREVEALLAEAAPAVDRIRQLAPGMIEAEMASGTHASANWANHRGGSGYEVVLRFQGLTFARWTREGIYFGAGNADIPLTPERESEFQRLVRDLKFHRSAVTSNTRHTLYRGQPERWLGSLIAADVARVDARLDPRFLYAQVPAVSSQDRGIIDLLGVTRSGRLAVIELKAGEDLQLVLQAVDYWLRVRRHHEQEDFSRYGYFPGVKLDSRPPLLFLVAPAIRFHAANDVLLRYLCREIEICRVGVNENWRRGVRVALRQC